jgi:ATP-binding cassette subfamily B protein
MGFFAGLNNEKYDRQYSDSNLVRRMVGYFSTQKKRMGVIVGLVGVMAALGAALPIIVSRVMDLLSSQPSTSQILSVGAVMVAIAFLNWALNWVRRSLTVRAVGDVVLSLRVKAFAASAEHDLSFYDQFSSGRIVSRITSDTNDFGQLVVIITDVASQIMQSIILGFVLAYTEWHLFLIMLAFIPVVAVIAFGFRSLARMVTRRGMQAMANVNAAVKETVSGIAVAKNFRQEQSVFESFDSANQQAYKVNVRRGFVLSLVFPVLNAVSGIFVGILVYAGGMSAAQDAVIKVGAWYLFITSLDYFMFPILNLTSFWAQIQSGLSAAERSFALIDADPNVIQLANNPVPTLKGGIIFDRLNFRYTDREPILREFSLTISPGENLALVGHTGAGKSSIAKLIARFYEFQEGRLLIDGLDIRSLDLQQYRRQLGIISQVPFLFSGSVAENIKYAAPAASDADIKRMANRIGDGEWVETLPNGLQTQVGERGARLSMGQRQLVALMRVLVLQPAIFILDEATASVDPFTEWQIQQALNLILANSTSILIAHRLSTVKAADRIVVMKTGAIIEQGTHDGLLKQAGHYAELYNTYFRHQSLNYKPPELEETSTVKMGPQSSGQF